MSPLSIWTYYRNNKRKVVPVMGIIALAILAISSTGALTESLFSDMRRELAQFERYAVVGSAQRGGLTTAMLDRLKSGPSVAEVVQNDARSTRIQGIFGSEGVPVYFLPSTSLRGFAARMGWEPVEGRWPEPGTNEVALTRNIIRNRGLRVGDHIGRTAYPQDFLAGDWVVVGVFPDAQVTGGVADLGYFQEHFLAGPGQPIEVARQVFRVAVAPVSGRESEMEAFLDSLPTEQFSVFHRGRAQREFDATVANANMIIWILNGVTIVVLTLALGLLNIIFFMQRANEFGLLAAIGYTKRFLMGRTFSEAATTVAIGWGLGIAVSQGIYALVSALLFTPKGLASLTVLTPRVLLFTVPVPVTVTLFSLAIVVWQLWRMDPVAIIERRD